MLKYLEKNVNPKGRKTTDCVARALTSTLGIPYEEVLEIQFEICLKTGYSFNSKNVYERVLKKFGFVKMKQPRKSDNSKYLVRELDKILDKNTRNKAVFVTVANHCTAVVGDNIIDIWDCGRKTVGNYYVKGEE